MLMVQETPDHRRSFQPTALRFWMACGSRRVPEGVTAETMTRGREDPTSWTSYLTAFHQDRPGITEEILGVSTSAAQNPYEWLVEAIPSDANLLDLACGSAPLLRAGWKGPWIGVDRSAAEVDRARTNGARNVVAAEANDLPFEDHQFSALTCSMALMLIDPLDDCLAEIARVLTPGGTIALLLPGGPSTLFPTDIWRWGTVLIALRRLRLRYPNDRSIRRLRATADRHHMVVITDDRRRFTYQVATTDAADRFLDSLYLPNIETARTDAARRVARKWIGSSIGIPLRRVRLCLDTAG